MDNALDIVQTVIKNWPAIAVELTALAPVLAAVIMICNGVKCLLRNEMLTIYYHNREKKIVRQYEYENFMLLYKAYKALRGNSFIDKIRKEVDEWEVVT